MIARSRLVGNFLSHCAIRRQLTRVIGLRQSVRFQSTSDNPDMNFTLKLPPNATGISVEHSNEKSLDGTSLRVTLNISVLQSDTRVSESEKSYKQPENLTRSLAEKSKKNVTEKMSPIFVSAPPTYDLLQSFNSKHMRENYAHRELKVTKNPAGDRTILIDGLSAEISKDAIQDYFSRFGDVELCRIPFGDQSAYVTFKSPKAINHVLNCAPHFIVDNRIMNEIPRGVEFAQSKNRDTATSQLLEVLRHEKNEKMIIVRGISKETSQDALRAHFSRFGNVDTCFTCCIRDCTTGYVTFKSPKTVNLVMDRGPHYLVGDRNDIASEEKPDKDRRDLTKFLVPSKDELTLTLGTLPPITNSLPERDEMDSFKEVFSKFGQVTHLNVECTWENGMRKESVYVTFANKEQVVNVLKNQPYFLDGQMLTVKPKTDVAFSVEDDENDEIDDDEIDSDDDATSDDEDDSDDDDYSDFDDEEDIDDDCMKITEEYDDEMIYTSFCDNSILVKNLPKNATGEKLQKIFSEFGELTDWGIKADGSYGWVSFARPVNVRTLKNKSPTMYGKKLDVEYVESAQAAAERRRAHREQQRDIMRRVEEDYGHHF